MLGANDAPSSTIGTGTRCDAPVVRVRGRAAAALPRVKDWSSDWCGGGRYEVKFRSNGLWRLHQRCVAGHLTQSLAYWVSVPVLLQLLYHFRRVPYTS